MLRTFDPNERSAAILAGPITEQFAPPMQFEPERQEPAVPNLPRYDTPLQLNSKQEKRMTDRAITRISELKREMGLEPDGSVRPLTFMGIRKRHEQTYDNDIEWRKDLGEIFQKSNFTLGENKRRCRLLAARVRDDLMATRPFFGAMMGGDGDALLVKQSETYLHDRIDESNIPDGLREAIKCAFIRDEAVIKTTYLTEESMYIGPAKVAVDARGLPIQTDKGHYIHENDDFIPDPNVAGLVRLKKDPSFDMPADEPLNFQRIARLPQKIVHYDNAHGSVLETRDFLCPLRVRSIHEADINVHLFEETVESLRAKYPNIDVSDRWHQSAITRPTTGVLQPKEAHGEHDETAPSGVIERIIVAECYMRFDADEDGQEEEIMLVLDWTNQTPIFYDYLGNHMRRRPFTVIPGVERVANRWYGVGVFGMMEHADLYVDAQFNRINEKDSQESSITFRNPNAVEQWRSGAPVEFGTRQVFDVAEGFDKDQRPPIWRVNLQSEANLGMEMMGLMRQAADAGFGVIGSKDASLSNMNQSRTATGILNIERDANVLSKDTEYDHVKAIEDVLGLAVELILDNIDEEVMAYSKDGSELVKLSRDEIRSLRRKVRLLLTRSRSIEQIVTNEKAEAVFLRYMRLNPEEKHYGRPFYIQQLKGLEVPDADSRLPEVTKEQLEAWYQAQQQQAAPKEDKEPSVNLPYKDAPDSVRRQIEADAGYEPASPEEIAQQKAEAQAEKEADRKAAKPAAAPKKKPTDTKKK